jgi:hypothetical protein
MSASQFFKSVQLIFSEPMGYALPGFSNQKRFPEKLLTA